jgi:hypothetical protein
MPKLSKVADDKFDFLPPTLVPGGIKIPPGMPADALYSPSRRKWLIPGIGIVED